MIRQLSFGRSRFWLKANSLLSKVIPYLFNSDCSRLLCMSAIILEFGIRSIFNQKQLVINASPSVFQLATIGWITIIFQTTPSETRQTVMKLWKSFFSICLCFVDLLRSSNWFKHHLRQISWRMENHKKSFKLWFAKSFFLITAWDFFSYKLYHSHQVYKLKSLKVRRRKIKKKQWKSYHMNLDYD